MKTVDPDQLSGSRTPEKSLPDISKDSKADWPLALDFVGMELVEMPIIPEPSKLTPGLVDLKVNLKAGDHKGIHMSRLYLLAEQKLTQQNLSPNLLDQLLDDLMTSQSGLSDQALIKIQFPFLLKRPALVSQEKGWRSYPVQIVAQKTQGEKLCIRLKLTVTYSSTCPCSAALARSLNGEKLRQHFQSQPEPKLEKISQWVESEDSQFATPHAQRSLAEVELIWSEQSPSQFQFEHWIHRLEQGLGTPVQTAVKREDEQEFAKLNGEHLMFCEDASRHLVSTLHSMEGIESYFIRVEHQESLHAHNAVAEVHGRKPH